MKVKAIKGFSYQNIHMESGQEIEVAEKELAERLVNGGFVEVVEADQKAKQNKK